MLDTLQTASPIVAAVCIDWPMILSTTGLSGLVGKMVWDWLKTPRSCQYHDGFVKDISNMKTDVEVIKNNVNWLIEFHKQGVK